MGNMSYCRFENTRGDIADCIEALGENDWNLESMNEAASDHEARGMRRFVKPYKEVADGFEDIDA